MSFVEDLWEITKHAAQTGVIEGIKSAAGPEFAGIGRTVSVYSLDGDDLKNVAKETYGNKDSFLSGASISDTATIDEVEDKNKLLTEENMLGVKFKSGTEDDTKNKTRDLFDIQNIIRINRGDSKGEAMHQTDVYNPSIPKWGYADWINERAMFQKQIVSIGQDKAWFYFKVFFKFDTNHGLLGGMLQGGDNAYPGLGINTAGKYLYYCKEFYKPERIYDRIHALEKFTAILSNISSITPWMIKGVKGLNDASKAYIKDFTKERAIELEFINDSLDQRLTTMMHLYRTACFDNVQCKEIIPENLRKFDMSVVVFLMPVKHLHTSMKSNSGITSGQEFNSKTLNPGDGNRKEKDWSNVMSFKLWEFKNCEFDMDSFTGVISSGINSENAFEMGETTVKINYDRVYMHTMNEFYKIMFGDAGFCYSDYTKFAQLTSDPKQSFTGTDTENTQEKRYQALSELLYKASYTPGSVPAADKSLITLSEAIVHDKMARLGGEYGLGNMFGREARLAKSYEYSTSSPEGEMTPMKIGQISDYWKSKIGMLKNRNAKNLWERRAVNWLIEKLFHIKDEADNKFGNLWGPYGEFKNHLRNGSEISTGEILSLTAESNAEDGTGILPNYYRIFRDNIIKRAIEFVRSRMKLNSKEAKKFWLLNGLITDDPYSAWRQTIQTPKQGNENIYNDTMRGEDNEYAKKKREILNILRNKTNTENTYSDLIMEAINLLNSKQSTVHASLSNNSTAQLVNQTGLLGVKKFLIHGINEYDFDNPVYKNNKNNVLKQTLYDVLARKRQLDVNTNLEKLLNEISDNNELYSLNNDDYMYNGPLQLREYLVNGKHTLQDNLRYRTRFYENS